MGRLTFDMSGGARGAKRPLARPLDGGVRRHATAFGLAKRASKLNIDSPIVSGMAAPPRTAIAFH